MKKVKSLFIGLFFLNVLLITSCNKDSESARLVIKLVDKAADYKEVNVDIQGISVHTNGDADETDVLTTDAIELMLLE